MKLFNDIRDKFTRSLRSSDTPIDLSGIKNEKFRALACSPYPGKVWNPVRGYPVNKSCFCGSGRKAKKCCLPHLAPVVSEEFAKHIKANWENLMTGEMTLPKSPKAQ